MNPRPRKTFADYLVISITPLLIMVMVAAVAFFVLELLYKGNYSDRMRWVMFWFVVASVLVSRISIEQGYGTASVYGLALGIATGLFIIRFHGMAWGALGLLAFIWWFTGKLTWDCTLIDDGKDASGQGLLQAGKLEKSATETSATDELPAPSSKRRRKDKQPHSPGLWILYFSLLALPAYGIGQAFFATNNPDFKSFSFRLLCAYIAAALSLLMATSFLGLRRYLRQRRLQMPGTVSITWMTMGTLIAIAVLVSALVLPRPDAQWSINALVEQAAESAEQASKHAMLGGESGEGEGREIGTSRDNKDESKGDKEQADGAKGGEQKSSTKPDGAAKGESPGKSSESGESGSPNPDAQQQGQSQGQSLEQPKTDAASVDQRAALIGNTVKWGIYAILLAVLIALAFWQRRRVARFIGAAVSQFMEFWRGLFGKRQTGAHPKADQKPSRPFSEFVNPFTAGTAAHMSATEAVVYSYDALEAWAVQQGMDRHRDRTPNEFAAVLAMQFPDVSEEIVSTARHYSRWVYAHREPDDHVKSDLARLWKFLGASANAGHALTAK